MKYFKKEASAVRPLAKYTGLGAIGAAVGAGTGAIVGKDDPKVGNKVLAGAITGAGIGLGATAVGSSIKKVKTMKNLREAKEIDRAFKTAVETIKNKKPVVKPIDVKYINGRWSAARSNLGI